MTNSSNDGKKLVSFKRRYGWKIFRRPGVTNKLFFEFQCYKGNFAVPRRQWLKTNIQETVFIYWRHSARSTRYPLRFHIYLERPTKLITLGESVDIIKKVYWKGPVAVGYQNGLRVVVANQLKVN
jgi:hypothetical protein